IGHVYLTEDVIRQEPVVVRIIFKDLVDDVGGFEGLIPILRKISSINHQGIMRVNDFNQWQGLVYLTTEHLSGKPLFDYCKTSELGPDIDQLKTWLADIGETLAWGELTMGHLGINPANIWIQPDGRLKLADYGFAALIPFEKRKTTAVARGNSIYLAPEIFEEDIDNAFSTDQFAIGQVFGELLEAASQRSSPESPGASGSSQLLGEIINTLIARNPNDRYQSTEAFREDIQRLTTRTKSGTPHVIRFLERLIPSRRQWAAVIAITGVLTLLPSTFVWLQDVDTDKRARRNDLTELQSTWREHHSKRMQFLAQLPRSAPESKKIWAALDPINETRWLSEHEAVNLLHPSWSEAQFSQRTGPLRKRLADFLETFRTVEEFADSLQALRRLSQQLTKIRTQHPTSLSDPLPSIDQAIREIETMADRGLFVRSATLAKEWLTIVNDYFDTELNRIQKLAYESKEQWHSMLVQANLPTTDPIIQVQGRLENAQIEAKQRTFPEAIDNYFHVIDTYGRWIDDWNRLPELASHHWVNSLGMRFVKIGEFKASIWETRILDFAIYVNESGADARLGWRHESEKPLVTPLHPVASLDDFDANGFCVWLTHRERELGLITSDQEYRLPNDHEWSRMAGLEDEGGIDPLDRHLMMRDHWPWGSHSQKPDNVGNYFSNPNSTMNNWHPTQDPYSRSSPVASFAPNAAGLYDIGGNIWEFTTDKLKIEEADQPNAGRSIRGASWRTISIEAMRTSFRLGRRSGREDIGFRCILAPTSQQREARFDKSVTKPQQQDG
ncbi:SUMF1/EgtB/PvdO family nonheme iron enzyme, partial [bacterium]|nr:SUMF1/EgtB/PvdO family nonheme iron enzyme [bacterium]